MLDLKQHPESPQRFANFFLGSVIGIFAIQTLADERMKSTRTDVFENPFLSVAEDPHTRVITGYLEASRIAPDRTDVCKLFLQSSKRRSETVKSNGHMFLVNAQPKFTRKSPNQLRIVTGEVRSDYPTQVRVYVPKSLLLGNCDWILSHIGAPAVVERRDGFEIFVSPQENGSWTGVRVAIAPRTYFFASPNEHSRGKSYVIPGDLLHVYDKKDEWYFAKFETGTKVVSGWVKRDDVLELQLP
ncbi:hypothetical protein E4K72_16235 [Oxalobacteraceae bacterium OM1]|nr:hypothetical protein E4K72_16235 [Oxalobacteraceae bacterium OM1]